MTLESWHLIVSAGLEVRRLLDHALPDVNVAAASNEHTVILGPAAGVLGGLRDEIRSNLQRLKVDLIRIVSEKDVNMVLYPLVIHFDEMVMRRLSKEEQTRWQLLQKDLFNINDGGDVFFDFINERLRTSDTPLMVFEVLYFCLSDGFIGKFSNDVGKLDQYKGQLLEKIQLPELPAAKNKKRRRDELEPAKKPISPRWFYAGTLGCLLLIGALFVLFTNI